MRTKKRHKPITAVSPREGVARALPLPERKKPWAEAFEPIQRTPLWSFGPADIGGPWCLSRLDAVGIQELLQRLKSYETMPWRDIEGPDSHFISVLDLIKPARDRLLEIGQDEVDVLFSLRISGPKRLWGIRDEHILRILWWDPEHQICPSLKKHT